MLVLTRREGERIVLSNAVRITVNAINNEVSLGIEAPDDVRVFREEIAPAELLAQFRGVAICPSPGLAQSNDTADVAQLALACATMEPFKVGMEPAAALTLIAHLQLALRHPGNRGESATWAQGFTRALIAKFPPEAQELLNRGWDPTYDVPVGGRG
jgi:carbon storage regulator